MNSLRLAALFASTHLYRIARFALPVVCVGVVGCTSVPRDAGFSDAQRLVAQRLPQTVQWNRNTEEDKAARAKVQEMLAEELTADTAVQIALLNNKDLQATYESLAVAQADLVAAGLLLNPVFDAQIRFAEGGGVGIDLGVVQDFLDVFQIPLRKRVAGAHFAAAKSDVAAAVVDLAGETRRAYYRLVAARQTIELRHTVVESYDASYMVARRLHDAGNITSLQLAREQGQYEQSKLDLASAETRALVQREQLAALMGLWGTAAQSWRVPNRLPELDETPVVTETFERTAVANSLTLARLRQRVFADVSRLNLQSNFALLNGSELTVGAAAERSDEGNWEVGPAFSLPIPIFNSGAPAVARARAIVRAANRRYEQEAINLRAAVRAAAVQLVAARQQAVYYERVLLPIRTTVLQQTQLTYNAMLIGPFQLIQAKRDQVETAVRSIEARQSYWLARTAIEGFLAGRSSGFSMIMPDESGSGNNTTAGGEGH